MAGCNPTLASKAQQREWLVLLDDPEARAPVGEALKAWLFGGASISTKVALFDLAGFEGEIVADLFGEDRYFASAEQFWNAQNAAVAERVEAYREAGWTDVVTLAPGQFFHSWEYERRAKRKGGKVYIAIGYHGDVTFHDGYIGIKDARALARAEAGDVTEKPGRPEITAAGNDYVDLHRHAAVRARLADAPGVALRVAVAHLIVGSPLWSVKIEQQRAGSEVVTESVELSGAEAVFDAKRRDMLALLDFDGDTPTITGGTNEGLASLFVRLLSLTDAQVMAILAVIVGETLWARSELVDLLGQHLAVDMSTVWQPDDALFDLIRDREVLLAMVGEVAGQQVAEANAKETGKVLKRILRDCLRGENGRPLVDGWVPRSLRFPASSYTPRGGVGAASRSAAVAAMIPSEPKAASPQIEPIRKAA